MKQCALPAETANEKVKGDPQTLDYDGIQALYLLCMTQLDDIPHHYHWPAKKFPRMNFQYSVSFSPAEYKYERHFFPILSKFLKFYDKCLKINKIGCL